MDHAKLATMISTPICLDESINSVAAAKVQEVATVLPLYIQSPALSVGTQDRASATASSARSAARILLVKRKDMVVRCWQVAVSIPLTVLVVGRQDRASAAVRSAQDAALTTHVQNMVEGQQHQPEHQHQSRNWRHWKQMRIRRALSVWTQKKI